MRVLYVTADGILEPIGFSQVARVVEGLARRGIHYDILSLEKERDLAHTTRVAAVEARLLALGIRWIRVPYDWSSSGRAAVKNLSTLVAETVRQARSGHIDAIHARAYHGAFAGLAAFTACRTPYLFDARSYWIDERLEERRWFTTPLRLGLARGVEHQLFANAAAAVTLTELQADDVRAGRFGSPRGPVVCIPTTADYTDFRPRRGERLTRVPADLQARLRGKLVLGIVGSINRSYLVDETLELARKVLRRRPDAHLLILSAQREEYEARLGDLDPARRTITRADHDAMPEWLSLIDWGLMLLNPSSPAKRASVPTKLAEFFATGVRPVQFGCNEEISQWVRKAGSGVVLGSVDGAGLEAAAVVIASLSRDEALLARAREVTQGHFSLVSGVDRYEALWREVLSGR